MSRLTRDGTGRDGTGRLNPSRETKFSGPYGDRGNIGFSCTADHEQDWQPSYPVDPYSAICDDWLFNDWGGRGYDDFVPVEVTKTPSSGDRTT